MYNLQYSAINSTKSTSDRRVASGIHRLSLLHCRVISILDSFSKLTKTSPCVYLQLLHSAVGFLFVHSIFGQSLLLATFEIYFLFQGVWLCTSQSLYWFSIR